MQHLKKHIHIRKNQFDNTAALVYGLNVSLVHLTLLMMYVIIIKWPNHEKAVQFDEEFGMDNYLKGEGDPFREITCLEYANGIEQWLIIMCATHFFCMIVNVFREVFETQLGSIG